MNERKPYPSDLNDRQWALLEPLIPPAKRGGRPRTVNMREVLRSHLRTPHPCTPLPRDGVAGRGEKLAIAPLLPDCEGEGAGG